VQRSLAFGEGRLYLFLKFLVAAHTIKSLSTFTLQLTDSLCPFQFNASHSTSGFSSGLSGRLTPLIDKAQGFLTTTLRFACSNVGSARVNKVYFLIRLFVFLLLIGLFLATGNLLTYSSGLLAQYLQFCSDGRIYLDTNLLPSKFLST